MERARLAQGRRKRRLLPAFLAALGLLLLACSNHSSTAKPTPSALASAPAVLPATAASDPPQVVVDSRDRFEIIPNLAGCEVDHQGLLIDLGSPAAAAYRGFGPER